MMEWWSVGIMGRRRNGTMEWWNSGIMKARKCQRPKFKGEAMECWNNGMAGND
jgi:hypothetical protein